MKVFGICGSLREGSFNRKLLKIAVKFARELGGEIADPDFSAVDLPVYNYDVQVKGFPPMVQKLKDQVEAADLLLIASPEYNYSIPGGLKNAIDWISRGKNSLDGKVAAIFGASSGGLGTIRGQFALRLCLTSVNALILPQPQVLVGNGDTAFNPDDSLKEPKIAEQLKELIRASMDAAAKLKK